MKKTIKLLLSLCLAFLCVIHDPASLVYAENFEGNEDEYYELCQSDDLSNSDIKVCRAFKEYISDKQASLDDQIAQNKAKINDLNLELSDVYQLIAKVSAQIAEQEDKIAVLDADIARLEADIADKDQRIRDRMYVLQSTVNSNVYLEFLMGASSMDEFFSRMSSIDELTEYDHDLIRGLNEDKAAVEESRQEANDEKQRLDDLKAQQDALAARLSEQIEEVSAEVQAAAAQSEEYKNDMAAISESIQNALINNGGFIDGPISSSGFSRPVKWGIVTAANWHYPSGGMHLGMDIGGDLGTELYAPCDGVVIYMQTGCASDGGYLGNYCGGGAGNYLVMLSQMDGTTYAIKYLHMTNNNYLGWSSGQFIAVSRGQVVGYLGHSGNSTGAHVHIEIFNLGPVSYTEGARMFAEYGTFFGTAYDLSSVCSGNGTPCREEASAMFGYSLYQEIGTR